MQAVSVIGLFCEDIREERTGQDILIGVLPDNLSVPSVPGALPKLGLYVRVHLDADSKPPQIITVKLINTDHSEIPIQAWTQTVIDKGFADAKINGLPIVGLILKVQMAPFKIPAEGKLFSQITIDGEDYIGSNLKIITTSANAPPQPASQSQPAS